MKPAAYVLLLWVAYHIKNIITYAFKMRSEHYDDRRKTFFKAKVIVQCMMLFVPLVSIWIINNFDAFILKIVIFGTLWTTATYMIQYEYLRRKGIDPEDQKWK